MTTPTQAHKYISQREVIERLTDAADCARNDIGALDRRHSALFQAHRVLKNSVDFAMPEIRARIPSGVGLWARLRWLVTGR
jgi:hypothetical protein